MLVFRLSELENGGLLSLAMVQYSGRRDKTTIYCKMLAANWSRIFDGLPTCIEKLIQKLEYLASCWCLTVGVR